MTDIEIPDEVRREIADAFPIITGEIGHDYKKALAAVDSVYALVAAYVRADIANQIADAIDAKRNEHWQQTKANNVRTPNDYGEHDAYYKAEKIARGVGESP